jgi:choline dehydrogenase-like flavoprotein
MGNMSLAYYQDQLGKVDPHVTQLVWDITAAKTVAAIPANSVALTAFDAIASQATIDDFLGSSSEFAVAAFGATPMGTDVFAAIVNMSGQMKQLVYVEALCYSGSGGSTLVTAGFQPIATLTAALGNEASVSSLGNVAVKVALSGLDALTDGTIVLKLHWIAK